MVLLMVNNVDFTDKVVQKKYKIQKQPVYSTWTDGNHVTHRDVFRYRVSGSVTMTFLSAADYDAFKAAVNAVKTQGDYCPISIYANNTKELLSINAFLDYETTLRWTQVYNPNTGASPEVASVTVTITER